MAAFTMALSCASDPAAPGATIDSGATSDRSAPAVAVDSSADSSAGGGSSDRGTSAGPSVTVMGGATGSLGDCRIGAADVTATTATLVHETAAQASVRQVVSPGQLLAVCGQLYAVAAIVPTAGGVGPGSSTHAVVIETTPVVVAGVTLKPSGLVLATGGRLYLGPGKKELSELTIDGTRASFKAGARGTAPPTTIEVNHAATVSIDGDRFGVVIVGKDPARGLTGWVELIPS